MLGGAVWRYDGGWLGGGTHLDVDSCTWKKKLKQNHYSQTITYMYTCIYKYTCAEMPRT